MPTEGCWHVHGPQQEATLLADWLERLLPHDPLTHARICKRARLALADLTALAVCEVLAGVLDAAAAKMIRGPGFVRVSRRGARAETS